MFQAALDAKDGDLWPAGSPRTDPRRRRTQIRRLKRTETLLGLRSADASAIARALDVPTLALLDAQREVESARSTGNRGAIIGRLLREVPVRPGVLDAVLIAGALTGVWGPPIRWEPARQRPRFLAPPPGLPP